MMNRAACLYLSLRRARPRRSTREEAIVKNKEEGVILLRRRDEDARLMKEPAVMW